MHPFLRHEYLWWFILLGSHYAFTLSFSSVQYASRSPELNELSLDSPLLVSDVSKSSTVVHQKHPYLSSQSSASVSCLDLEGVGSFNTTCLLHSNLRLNSDLYIFGTGNLEILPHVSIVCPIVGCSITFNLSGNVNIGQQAMVVAGSIVLSAANLTMDYGSSVNTTALGGSPPSQTSGTPFGYDGAGGGHGGRGASCVKNNKTSYWGGDVYAWSSLSEPWSYGSKGGGTSAKARFGGNGGGRVKLLVKDMLHINGSVTAEGGYGGSASGGGSGGSIIVHAVKL